MRRDSEKKYRFLINTSEDHLEVHDLDNEKTGPSECQIDEIIRGGNYKFLITVTDDGLRNWLAQNPQYDGCKYCLPLHHRK